MPWLDDYLTATTKKICCSTKTKGGGKCCLNASVGSDYCKYHGGEQLARFIDPERAECIRTYTGNSLEKYCFETLARLQITVEVVMEKLYGT